MSDLETDPGWICPYCYDDHEGRECKPDDLKTEIANLRDDVKELREDLNRSPSETAKELIDHLLGVAGRTMGAMVTREYLEHIKPDPVSAMRRRL